ncbi:MAG: hypothetical protein NWE89_00590 [Candidatus Bathyarchaeota archaeon]|nr:hypothetical protein [Candidatus Bathyarchaeota archaeon]
MWAVELTAYHAIVSVTIPIILVELMYPEMSAEPWLNGKWLKIIPGLLLADVVFGLFAFSQFTGFTPPVPQYLLMMLFTVVFIILARSLPRDWARRGTKPIISPRKIMGIPFSGAIVCGFIFGVLPDSLSFPFAPVFVILLGVFVVVGAVRYLVGFDWNTATPLHRYSLAAGPLALFIIFSVFQEFDGSRLDNTSGMAFVGFAFLVGLLLLGKRLRNYTMTEHNFSSE